MKTIPEIMEQYKAGELTLEEANAALKEQEAGFTLNPLTEDEAAAKREAEREGEFVDIGRKSERLPDKADLSRRTDLAGQVIVQKTKIGAFAVHYDEDGYAVKAERVNS